MSIFKKNLSKSSRIIDVRKIKIENSNQISIRNRIAHKYDE